MTRLTTVLKCINCSLDDKCSHIIMSVNMMLKEGQIPINNVLILNLYKEVTA